MKPPIAHFCRSVPIEMLHLRHEYPVEAPWRHKLRENIAAEGLASPLVANMKNGKIIVRGGQNRLRCLRELGWKHVPCLISGDLPDGLDGVPIYSCDDGQQYLADGTLAYNEHEKVIKLNSAMLPESEKYPTTDRRYWDVD